MFWCVPMRISPTKSTFFQEKILVTLDTHTKKMTPPSFILGGHALAVRLEYFCENANINFAGTTDVPINDNDNDNDNDNEYDLLNINFIQYVNNY